MAYATEQDMIDRYGEDAIITAFDRDGDGASDSAAVDKALLDASEEIDGYLAGRYSLPLVSAPKILTFMAVDIALYKASGSDGTAQTDEKRQRYEDAIKFLTQVAKGSISLGIENASRGGGACFTCGERIFTRSLLKGSL